MFKTVSQILKHDRLLRILRYVLFNSTKYIEKKEKLIFYLKLEEYLKSLIRSSASNYIGSVYQGKNYKNHLTHYVDFFVDNTKDVETIVDFGCGDGHVLDEVSKNKNINNTIGVDILEDNIKKAIKRNILNANFYLGDVYNYHIPENVDCVLMSNFLEHVEKRVELLKKIKCAKKLKKVIVRVPCYDRDWIVPLKKEMGLEWRLDTTHYIEYTKEVFEKEIKESGFIIDIFTVNWSEIWAVLLPKKN